MSINYSNISFRQIDTLLQIIEVSQLVDDQYIRAQYEQHARNYDDTLNFSKDVGIVTAKLGGLHLAGEFEEGLGHEVATAQKERGTKRSVIRAIAESKGTVTLDVGAYVGRFIRKDGRLMYTPSMADRLHFSGIRNLLMDLEALIYDEKNDLYLLADDTFKTLGERFQKNGLSPSAAARMRQENDELGVAAERAVMLYEQKRLSSYKLPGPIEWVAQEDVSLGYDILSYHIGDSDGSPARLHIEVKAVSKRDYAFHWTRGEMDAAKHHGANYTLYLVPVLSEQEFDLDRLKVIMDPYRTILIKGSGWERREEVVFIRRSSTSTC